jgi:ElaB/YqjD/DUF883 family membrane-anchored ribosome-binding protein
MNTTVESAREAVTGRLTPALESLEENMRDARRAIARGRRRVEDFADETTVRVRQHPLTSMAAAAGAGAVAGCLLGFALGWKARRTTPDR